MEQPAEVTKLPINPDAFWDGQPQQQQQQQQQQTANPNNRVMDVAAPNNLDRNLNFSIVPTPEETDYGFAKKKTVRDPLSHRIIEKRRRDRMNNCLADLARLLPASSLRKGRGRIEKTEIVELAIKNLRHLKSHKCPHGDACEFNEAISRESTNGRQQKPASIASSSSSGFQTGSEDSFRIGFQECLSETVNYLLEHEGMFAGDPMFHRIIKHLERYYLSHPMRNNDKLSVEQILKVIRISGSQEYKPLTGSSGDSISSGYEPNGGSSSGSDANGGQDGEPNEMFALPSQQTPLSQECKARSQDLGFEDEQGDNTSRRSYSPVSLACSEGGSSDKSNEVKPSLPSIIGSSSANGCSPRLSSSNGRSSDESSNHEAAGHRYKFKTNIKQRFNADLQTKKERRAGSSPHHSTQGGPKSQESSSSDQSASTVEDNGPEECRKDEKFDQAPDPSDELNNPFKPQSTEPTQLPTTNKPIDKENSSNTNNNQTRHHQPTNWPMIKPPNRQGTVPAFALHENGPFYIPLTIDKSVVTPFLNAIEPTADPPLHPVTISVCFLLSTSSGEKKIIKPTSGITPISIPIPIPLSVAPAPLITRASIGSHGSNSTCPTEFPPGFLMSGLHHHRPLHPSMGADMYRPYNAGRFSNVDSFSRSSMSNSSSSCISLNSSIIPSGLITAPELNAPQPLYPSLPPCYSNSSSASGSDSGKGGSGSATGNNESGNGTSGFNASSSGEQDRGGMMLGMKDNMSSSGGSSMSVPVRRSAVSPTRKRSSSRSPCGGSSHGYHSWNEMAQYSATGGVGSGNDYRYALAAPLAGFFNGPGSLERNGSGGPMMGIPQWVLMGRNGFGTPAGAMVGARPTKTRRLTARERDQGNSLGGSKRGRRVNERRPGEMEISQRPGCPP